MNDPGVQNELRASLGFCNRHAHSILEMGDGLGIAILYRVVVDELRKTLSRIPDDPSPRTSLASLFGRPGEQTFPKPGDGCMVCRAEDKAERRYLEALLECAGDGSPDLDGPGAVCMRHLSRAFEMAGGWLPPALVEVSQESLNGLDADLGRYIRHNDYKFSEEPWGEERDAWIRAVRRVAGGSQA